MQHISGNLSADTVRELRRRAPHGSLPPCGGGNAAALLCPTPSHVRVVRWSLMNRIVRHHCAGDLGVCLFRVAEIGRSQHRLTEVSGAQVSAAEVGKKE